MSDQTAAPQILAQANDAGNVNIAITDGTKILAGIEMPPEGIGHLIASLCAAASNAAQAVGAQRPEGESMSGVPCFVPTRIGLTAGEPPEPHAISIHAGMARVGFSLETTNIREFANALLAASAPQGRPQ